MNDRDKNEYMPYPVRIEEIRQETFDTKSFRVSFVDNSLADNFTYLPGQFMEISLIGTGEAPISITSSPSRRGFLEFTIRSVGKMTKELHKLKKDDIFHLRGPYGNSFPFAELKGKNLYFIVGGIGMVPLRSLINMVFNERKDFNNIRILYGAKTPDELCFKEELEAWKKIPDTEVWLTVDKPDGGWNNSVGVVTELWKKVDMNPDNAVALICGPPIMIKFVIRKLLESGFQPGNIIMTLERYMKCGIGKCGHCNVGGKFICTDGPVFTYEQVKKFPAKERVSE